MKIKTVALGVVFAALAGTALAQTMSPEAANAAGIPTSTPSTQQMRTDQMMDKLQQQILQLRSDMRDLQRQNMAMQKKVDDANAKSAGVSDQVQQFQNVNLVNVTAAQKQIVQQNNDILKKLWGEGKRDCPELSAKHQQIKVLTRPDGGRTVRFLCFDGKAIHLGTEVHDPAE
jgi:predicted RNase H-like nuclease (RuvC/YqgF family)